MLKVPHRLAERGAPVVWIDGGSLQWVRKRRALPGPVCYDKGGETPW
jgi:hypothetical protein